MLAVSACQMLGLPDEAQQKGELRISFNDGQITRISETVPDTSDFLITVSDSDGEIIYDGSYGASPESIMVDAGSYDIYVRSCDFSKPAFSTPQFGERQCVVVPSGGVCDVKLTCVQMNAGIRLRIDESFLKCCPDAVLFLKSSSGKLMYSFTETRVAYFLPGNVSLMMSENSVDRILFTRELQPRSVLDIAVSAASDPDSPSKESISVAVDTTRNWTSESYVIGEDENDEGEDMSRALTVSQALSSIGAEEVWVSGYIVGGDLTSSSASFDPPFTSRTNIVLGPRSSTDDRDACLSVNLPSGSVREGLNLVDNPSLLGRKVYIKGDIVEAYYGIPGLKNVVGFELQ